MRIIYQNASEPYQLDENVDWVVHAASPASPLIMKNDPVGTIAANALGTWNALQVAKSSNAKGFLFISSEKYMDNHMIIKKNFMKILMA